MAGLWNLSFQQLHDLNGSPYPGAKAYFYAADSLTPVTVYQDYGLGTAHPNPVESDAYGVFPAVFFDEADNFYRQRITNSAGVIIGRTDLPIIPIIGPSGGGGGSEVPVDPNALFQTGDLIWLDQSGTRAGWVRDNGRTIGSSTSGASERANADCETLFNFLWQNYSDTICPVTGGRGANSAADWAANKPIGTPDKRGYVPGGLPDMGNSDSGRWSGITTVSGSYTTAGGVIGKKMHTLITSEIPVITPAGTISQGTTSFPAQQGSVGAGGILFASNTAGFSFSLPVTPQTFTGTPFGGGGAHENVQPTVLGSFYRKL